MILNISNENYSKFETILDEAECIRIIPYIKWAEDEMYSFVSKNDRLSKSEIKRIYKIEPKFDFLLQNDCIEIETANCRNFNIAEYINKKIVYEKLVTAPIVHYQVSPIQNSPTFKIQDCYYVWRPEISLFEMIVQNTSVGFHNSKSSGLVFKERNQYEEYLKEINFLKSKLETQMIAENNERFVRVITVYDKLSKELKYRILNEEFNYNSFAYLNLKQIEGDDFFFKSYLITKKIAHKYSSYITPDVDYDFDKNEYYFETLNANSLTYSVGDKIKNYLALNKKINTAN